MKAEMFYDLPKQGGATTCFCGESYFLTGRNTTAGAQNIECRKCHALWSETQWGYQPANDKAKALLLQYKVAAKK